MTFNKQAKQLSKHTEPAYSPTGTGQEGLLPENVASIRCHECFISADLRAEKRHRTAALICISLILTKAGHLSQAH